MKRKFFLALTMVLTTSFLASCSACDSCSGNTKITFKDYYLQNETLNPNEVFEQLEYTVTHEKADTYNGYKVNYTNGKYVTTLEKEVGIDYYTLRSTLTMDVTYSYKGSTTEGLTDTVVSEIQFYSAGNTLRPITSTKTLHTHTPYTGEVTKLSDCYVEYHQTVETTYNEKLSDGVSVITDHLKDDKQATSKFTIEDMDKTTYVDNEQLLFAVRCMTSGASGTLQVYEPFAEKTQEISISADSSKKTTFQFALDGAAKASYELSYVPVTIKINATNSGPSQTAWIASTTSATDNTYRNVMLKYVVPMPYTSLGELHYDLVSMTRAQ